jgi:hypothetical protein
MTELTRNGGCLCGAVRFSVTLPSKWCAHCHCTMCRRAHGAAFVTWFGMKEERFAITQGEDELLRFASSDSAWRGFCRRCGTTMLFGGARWPGEVHIALACVDGDIDRAPSANTYWHRHVAWGLHPEQLPRYGGEDGTQPID